MVVIGSKNIKEMVGLVVSAKGDKTITVQVTRVKEDTLYKKRFTVRKKYYAHDETNEAREGDQVRIRETRPVSKLKRRKLIKIVKKSAE